MLVEQIRKEMITALKAGDKEKKDTLSLLVSALDLRAKEKRDVLTEDEEFVVLRKEVKQANETLESCPADRTDIIDKCKGRISVIESFLPQLMDEVKIKETIESVLSNLGIENPSKSDKGNIMKNLMPLVKGKADGKLVNMILESYMK